MLGNNYLCQSGLAWVFVQTVIVRPVYEHYNVRILLNCSRFAEVAQLRTLVAASGLHRTAQLGEGNDWHIKLLGGCLKRSGDGCHLLLAHAPQLRRTGHKLQVVYYYQFDSCRCHKSSGF